MCVEGPSSAHSGSSQQPTASPRPGKEGQEQGYPLALADAPPAAPRATPVPFPCGMPSAWALQSPAETLLRRELGSCHGFLAASSLTRLEPKACRGSRALRSTAFLSPV